MFKLNVCFPAWRNFHALKLKQQQQQQKIMLIIKKFHPQYSRLIYFFFTYHWFSFSLPIRNNRSVVVCLHTYSKQKKSLIFLKLMQERRDFHFLEAHEKCIAYGMTVATFKDTYRLVLCVQLYFLLCSYFQL